MIQDKRLDKVEGSLTAKQAVVLWLEEIRQHPSVYEYDTSAPSRKARPLLPS